MTVNRHVVAAYPTTSSVIITSAGRQKRQSIGKGAYTLRSNLSSIKSTHIFRYVQMLERRQVQLTAGVQELYQRQQIGHISSDQRPKESHYKKPPTHEILDGLGILDSTEWDDSDHSECVYEAVEEYSSGSKRSTETTASPVTPTILPAAQIAFPRLLAAAEPQYDDQTDHRTIQDDACNDQTPSIFPSRPSLPLSTLDNAVTETLRQFQQQTDTFDIHSLQVDDQYIPEIEIDTNLSTEIDGIIS